MPQQLHRQSSVEPVLRTNGGNCGVIHRSRRIIMLREMRRTKITEVLLLQLQLFTMRRMRCTAQEVEGFHRPSAQGNWLLESSDIEDYSRKTNLCKDHDDAFRFFCDACQICICRDCAILDHDGHKKISLEKGLEIKTTEIENKIREVQANRSHLGDKKESLEKHRIKVMNS